MQQELQQHHTQKLKMSKPSKNAEQRKEKKEKRAPKRVSNTPVSRIDPMIEKIAHLMPPEQEQTEEEVFNECMAILSTIKRDHFSKNDVEATAPAVQAQ